MAKVTKSPEVMANEVFTNFGKYDEELEMFVGMDIENLEICVNMLKTYVDNQKKVVESEKTLTSKLEGKSFYDKLPNGAEFTVIIGGKKTLVKKVASKSATSGSARCSRIENGEEKIANIKFDKVVVPKPISMVA